MGIDINKLKPSRHIVYMHFHLYINNTNIDKININSFMSIDE